MAFTARPIAEVILPSLAAGKWVLCDRFTDSTEAYQGGGRGLGSAPLLELHKVLCGDVWPDLTILMDSDVNSSVSRARRRNKNALPRAKCAHGSSPSAWMAAKAARSASAYRQAHSRSA